MAQISADLRLRDLLSEYPEAEKVIFRHGMRCLGCKGLSSERVRQAAQNHGLPLDHFLAELKSACREAPGQGRGA